MQKQYDKGDISKLIDIMTALRTPDTGCPWDLEQDFDTIAPYTIEEAYEVADAIEREAFDELPDELGDLLLQVVFHAQMARERGLFQFGDVVDAICDKMVRRHPHVFGDLKLASGSDVMRSWEEIKRGEKSGDRGRMDDIAVALPALVRAAKIGRRAASVGFDWPEAEPVRDKLDEELGELDQAVAGGDAERIEAEVGDLLFTAVNLCRHLGIDADRALRRANDRFVARFGHIEAAVRASGGDWDRFDAAALEALWDEAKRRSDD